MAAAGDLHYRFLLKAVRSWRRQAAALLCCAVCLLSCAVKAQQPLMPCALAGGPQAASTIQLGALLLCLSAQAHTYAHACTHLHTRTRTSMRTPAPANHMRQHIHTIPHKDAHIDVHASLSALSALALRHDAAELDPRAKTGHDLRPCTAVATAETS